MKRLLAIAVLATAVMASPFFAQAADKAADAPKTEKKAKPLPFNGKIGSVDKAAKTVTLEGKEKSRTFQITSETKIKRDKKPATLDEVVIGDKVGGSARESADGKQEVITLNLTSAPKTTKAK